MKAPKLVGVSGGSCSGKTTLCALLKKHTKNSVHLNMDDYYLPKDKDHLKFIPELNSLNFDTINAIDLERFHRDLKKFMHDKSVSVIFLDGFVLYDDDFASKMLDRKYLINLSKEESMKRRTKRVYNSTDETGYFEKCVWPEHLKYRKRCEAKFRDHEESNRLTFIDGTKNLDQNLELILRDLQTF
jgi:uridine kinase